MRRRHRFLHPILVLFGAAIAVKAFLPRQYHPNHFALFSKSKNCIYYSPNFHRHVVCESQGNTSGIVESFIWLDEAKWKYPKAPLLATASSAMSLVAGGGLEEDHAYNGTRGANQLCSKLSPSQSSESTMQKCESVVGSLSSKLGSPFFSYFPESDHHWVRERILFLLSPSPESPSQPDWPQTFSGGYGAGLSQTQAISAILALRHLLSIHPPDASSKKPPLLFFYQQLGIQFDMISEVREELGHWLFGACPADVATFSYLKSLNISWDQCRILLGAFSSSLISCELDPGWELAGSGPVRGVLSEESLTYLRMRLQLSPSEVFAMIKTHSRLSSYSATTLKSHLDAIQSKLCLSSEDLRRVVFRTPSVLGVSVGKLDQRIAFLSSKANLSLPQIRKSVVNLPSLLQYSIESNLEPKVRYLKEEVGIPSDSLRQMIATNPSLLGYSLERTMARTVQGLRETCDLSSEEVGTMLVQVPQLLSLNWKTNLEPKVMFLKKRLSLTKSSIGSLLKAMPRILVHSVSQSLEPKLQMLEQAAGETGIATKVVLENPSLLLTNKDMLERRLRAFKASNTTFVESFRPRRANSDGDGNQKVLVTRRKRAVLELADDIVVQTLSDVGTAASVIGTTRANMYNIIKSGRVFNGKSYAYGSMNEQPVDSKQNNNASKAFLQDSGRNYVPDERKVRLVEVLQNESILEQAGVEYDGETKRIYLAAFVSGRAYPPEKSSEARGRYKAGGLSIYFPQLDGCQDGGKLLRAAAERSLANQIIPNAENGTTYCDGTILLWYPAIKPSRNRCGLYVCREALRVILDLLSLEAESCTDLPETTVEIDIFTDSNYVWDLLHNSTSLLRWGSHSRFDEFVYDGELPEWKANLDTLYPLAKTYYRLVNQLFVGENVSKSLAKEVRIRFRHGSEVAWSWNDPKTKSIGALAEVAATWQYEREHKSLI